MGFVDQNVFRNFMTFFLQNSKLVYSFQCLNQVIQEMHSELECAKQCMWGAQERSKCYADQIRSLRQYKVGQKVVNLKVTPKCSRLKLGRSRKLPPKFYGHFKLWKELVKCCMR